jgi:hypothetical protein
VLVLVCAGARKQWLSIQHQGKPAPSHDSLRRPLWPSLETAEESLPSPAQASLRGTWSNREGWVIDQAVHRCEGSVAGSRGSPTAALATFRHRPRVESEDHAQQDHARCGPTLLSATQDSPGRYESRGYSTSDRTCLPARSAGSYLSVQPGSW